ncbi:(2Fe-2S)-binding protein, partial [Chloroflexota bacterium]
GGSTVTQGGSTVTVGGSTVTLPGSTVTVGAGQTVTATATETKFVDPIDGMEFDTLAELKAHFDSAHGATGAIPGVITMNVNGDSYLLQIEPEWTLAFVLREKCLLIGTKIGCNRGECGTCTIIMNGKTVYSCMVLAIEADGAIIETVEGLGTPVNLSALQEKYAEIRGGQCGFCTPGFLMSATDLLRKNPNPTLQETKQAISGHLCVCGNMTRIIRGIMEAGGA